MGGLKSSGGRSETSVSITSTPTGTSLGSLPSQKVVVELSKSGFSDLITSPHRASGVGAILLSRTLLCSRPSALNREQGTSDPERSEQKICHPVTGAWSPFLLFGQLKR